MSQVIRIQRSLIAGFPLSPTHLMANIRVLLAQDLMQIEKVTSSTSKVSRMAFSVSVGSAISNDALV